MLPDGEEVLARRLFRVRYQIGNGKNTVRHFHVWTDLGHFGMRQVGDVERQPERCVSDRWLDQRPCCW